MKEFVKRNKALFLVLFVSTIFFAHVSAEAAKHSFSISAFDWDATANDWEGDGTEDPIEDGGYLEPGQVFKINLDYEPGPTTVTSMQM